MLVPVTFVNQIFRNFAWNDDVKSFFCIVGTSWMGWGRVEWYWHMGMSYLTSLNPHFGYDGHRCLDGHWSSSCVTWVVTFTMRWHLAWQAMCQIYREMTPVWHGKGSCDHGRPWTKASRTETSCGHVCASTTCLWHTSPTSTMHQENPQRFQKYVHI